MKKILSSILVCMLLVGTVFSLAGCVLSLGSTAIISGTYEVDLALAEYTFEFSPIGKFTITEDPLIGDSKVYEGKYKVNTETNEITLTYEADAPLILGSGTYDFAYGKENDEEYIKISILTLEKED